MGEPDYVPEFEEMTVPGGGPDQFRNFLHETTFDEDKWVKAVEIQPGNSKVVHHVILWQGSQANTQGWLGAWAAGNQQAAFPKGTGRFIKKGTPIIGDMHYHAAETDERDVTRVGLHFADASEIEKKLINLWIVNAEFEIPPGDPNYEARASYTFPQDSVIFAITPHMHYRGKDFQYTAVFPDGRREELLKVSKYDFNWQTTYDYEQPLEVPEGTRIECVAHWDNSPNNPANPDPNKTVRFGNESYDEMMIGFADYVVVEGIRPEKPVSPLPAKINELKEKFPGEVYLFQTPRGLSGFQLNAVLIPRQGEGGWYLDFNGIVGKARIYDIVWEGDSFTCLMQIPGEELQSLKGSVDGDAKTMTFMMTMPNGSEFPLTGKLAE